MDPVEREWRTCRLVLDINKHEWVHNVLPRYLVPDDLKATIEQWFTIVYGHFQSGVKDVTTLQIIIEDLRVLTRHLVSAASLSNMEPSVTLH